MIIKINKLFGKYNNEINLNNKCNIYIGENGIGKSTIIKILNCLFNFNYIGLTKYYFDSIEIIENNELVKIYYSDLTLDNEYLIKKCCEKWNCDYNLYVNYKKEFDLLKQNNYIYESDINVFNNDVGEAILNIMKYIIYPFDNFCKNIDNRLLYKILKFDFKFLGNETLFILEENSSRYLDYIKETYINSEKSLKDGIYYKNSNISELHFKIKNIIKKLNYNEVLVVNMASDFFVTNNLSRKYVNNSVEKDTLTKEYKEMLDDNKHNTSLLEQKVWYGGLNSKYKGFLDDVIINKLKDNFKVLRNVGYQENKIDFGYFLFNKIYTDDLINEFKNDFYDYLHDNIKNNKFDKLNFYKLNDKSFNKLRTYFYPMLDENNVLNSYFNIDIRNDKMEYENRELLFLIVDFYQKYKEKYFEIENDKLKKLNNLFKKYFKNKEIIATPFGISISTNNFMNDINFEELSTGEKKIIILFIILVFSDDLIILLDEPETSLSIVWQEQLIPDLINNTKFNKLIIATQSPYICESEELDDFIIPLIDGVENE